MTKLVQAGPPGSTALCLAVRPNRPQTVLIGMEDAGVWRSEDGGATATHITAQAGDASGTTIAIDPGATERMFFGCSLGGGVWGSLDGGRTWSRYVAGLPEGVPRWAHAVHSLAFDPEVPGRLVAYTLDGLYMLDSRARSPRWRRGQMAPELPRSDEGMRNVTARIWMAASRIGLLLAGGDTGAVYLAPTAGGQWQLRDRFSRERVAHLALEASSGSAWIATTGRNQVIVRRSRDAGRSWHAVHRIKDAHQAFVAVAGRRIYVAAWSGHVSAALALGRELLRKPGRMLRAAGVRLDRSDDDGATWTTVTADVTDRLLLGCDVDPSDPSRVWLRARGVTLRSDDGGRSWTRVLDETRTVRLRYVAGSRDRVWACDPGDGGLPGSGALWTLQDGRWHAGESSGLTSIAESPTDAGIWLAGTLTRGVLRSRNDGRSWAKTKGTAGTVFRVAWGGSGRIAYASVPGAGVLRSSNTGVSWVRRFTLATSQDVLAASGGRVWVAGRNSDEGGCWHSADGATTWTNLGPKHATGISLALDPEDTLYLGTLDGLLRSTDHGRHWRRADPGWTGIVTSVVSSEPGVVDAAVSALDGLPIFKRSPDPGWYRTTDACRTWTRLTETSPAHLAIVGPNIWAAGSGLWRTPRPDGATWS